MPQSPDQILTAAQMRSAEAALIASGTSVDELMQRAGRGAADTVWRIAAHRRVTVLCGPGNNGGDGYVIAEAIRARGGRVSVIAAAEPNTDAARTARALYQGEVLGPDADPSGPDMLGEVFVDCLFGSGLARPLSDGHAALLLRLAASHRHTIAIDLPSGVAADSGMLLNADLPLFELTIALGAWKFAHFLMPASATLGALRLVGIGVEPVAGAAWLVGQPSLAAPAPDAHKYRRGLLGVVGGAMPGAALLAARAAQGAGAGYVKLLGWPWPGCFDKLSMSGTWTSTNPAQPELVEGHALSLPHDLVVDAGPLAEALSDRRYAALLVGPGLGRHAESLEQLVIAMAAQVPAVLDADALILLTPRLLTERTAPLIATPHEGELAALEHAFGCQGTGSKPERAAALAAASGMVIVAKGPDTVIAAPDGRLACAPRTSSWLSVAGTGDVLAGTIASRLASGAEAFAAACEGVWLHGEAARQCPPPFTASQLAKTIPSAYAACL